MFRPNVPASVEFKPWDEEHESHICCVLAPSALRQFLNAAVHRKDVSAVVVDIHDREASLGLLLRAVFEVLDVRGGLLECDRERTGLIRVLDIGAVSLNANLQRYIIAVPGQLKDVVTEHSELAVVKKHIDLFGVIVSQKSSHSSPPSYSVARRTPLVLT